MDLVVFLIDRIGQFLTGILVNVVMLLVSKKEIGNWLSSYFLIQLIFWLILFIITLIYPIPLIYWIFLAIITIIGFIVMLIRKKMEYNNPYDVGDPYYGWKNIDQIEYSGVLWLIRTPNGGLLYDNPRPSIDVEVPARCPICVTQLDEVDNFLWYTWFCVDENCNFKLRKWDTMNKMEDRVNKVAKRKLGL